MLVALRVSLIAAGTSLLAAAPAGARAPAPDLRLSPPSPALAGSAHPGDRMAATVRVRNAGRAGSGRGTLTVLLSSDASRSADDVPVASARVPALRPRQVARVRVTPGIPTTATAGPHSLLVCLTAPKPAAERKPRLPRCLVAPLLVTPVSLPPDGPPPAGGDPGPTTPSAYYFKVLDAAMTTHTLADKTNTEDQGCARSGFPVHGGTTLSVSTADGAPPNELVKVSPTYSGLAGDFTVDPPGTFSYDLRGCQGQDTGGPVTLCQKTFDRRIDSQTIGFSFTAPSASAQNATINWLLPPASAGFVASDDSVCNVEEMFQGLTNEQKAQTIPMSTFMGTKPFTLNFSGQADWTSDQQHRPATIHHDWTYTIVVQRVDAAGHALS